MSKVCEITGKKPAVANNVSHAQNKTKRRQMPNLQNRKFESEILGKTVSLVVSTSAIRTVDKHGGLDQFLLNYKKHKMFSAALAKVRKAVKAKVAA
jgi:large subunit ribosomal protein L28